jgi:hypothetical protein
LANAAIQWPFILEIARHECQLAAERQCGLSCGLLVFFICAERPDHAAGFALMRFFLDGISDCAINSLLTRIRASLIVVNYSAAPVTAQ